MSDRQQKKLLGRKRRHNRIRAKISGTAARPRLAVFRSASHIYAQIIDDKAGKTLAAYDDLKLDSKTKAALAKGEERSGKTAVAYEVGKQLAAVADKAGISEIVFDRGGFSFTGRVAALAQGARDGGLKF